MPRCDDCKHAGDRHAERNAGLAPPDEDETVFPCLDCGCVDYEAELILDRTHWGQPIVDRTHWGVS